MCMSGVVVIVNFNTFLAGQAVTCDRFDISELLNRHFSYAILELNIRSKYIALKKP